ARTHITMGMKLIFESALALVASVIDSVTAYLNAACGIADLKWIAAIDNDSRNMIMLSGLT
ncbi:TPA: hypothetical protein ACTY22_005437, partial [Klebsiella michiganensis]|nr:hypothetical protein [Klebsiella michiganensis]MDQ4327671.1 hypothetical protein [Klebsiella michiganensis]